MWAVAVDQLRQLQEVVLWDAYHTSMFVLEFVDIAQVLIPVPH